MSRRQFEVQAAQKVFRSLSRARTCWYKSPGYFNVVINYDFGKLLCVSRLANDLNQVFMLAPNQLQTCSNPHTGT